MSQFLRRGSCYAAVTGQVRARPGRIALWLVAVALTFVSLATGQESEAELERFHRVADLLKLLNAQPGASIADVGAGDGFFTVRIARAVAPNGRVTAVDINESALSKLRERATREAVSNIDTILGTADDPRLTEAHFDAVLIHNAYHEMPQHEAMLAHVRSALKPSGRFVLVEPMHESSRGLTRDQQVDKHDLEADIAEAELRAAKFDVVQRDDRFVRGTAGASMWLIVARPE